MKSTNTNIWLIGTLSQMFFTGFYAQTSFQIKKKLIKWLVAKLRSL